MKKASKLFIILLAVCIPVILAGCLFTNDSNVSNDPYSSAPDTSWIKHSVNEFIEYRSSDYKNIYSLECDPGPNVSIKSTDHDKLRELINLKTVKFIGLPDAETAEAIYEELSGLEHLETIILENSPVGSVKKLGEINSLRELRITLNPGGIRYAKDDISSLSTPGAFERLTILELDINSIDTLPDLSHLKELETLIISGSKLSDNADLSFVLSLPELKEFRFHGNISQSDMELLKQHPNFNDSWLQS